MKFNSVLAVLIRHQEHILTSDLFPARLCVHSFLSVLSLGLHDSVAYPSQSVLLWRCSTLLSPPLQQPFHRLHIVSGHQLFRKNITAFVNSGYEELLLFFRSVIVGYLCLERGNKVCQLDILCFVLGGHLLVKTTVLYNIGFFVDTSVYVDFNWFLCDLVFIHSIILLSFFRITRITSAANPAAKGSADFFFALRSYYISIHSHYTPYIRLTPFSPHLRRLREL